MASHGEPALGPVFADWESQVDYADVTDFIDDLGDEMGTTEPEARSNTGILGHVQPRRMAQWHALPGGPGIPHHFERRHLARDGQTGMDLMIQTVCYGFYNPIKTLGSDTVIQRNGGHCMTFVGAERLGSDRRPCLRP